MERVQARPGFQFRGHVGWRELSPALMVRSRCFAHSRVSNFLWHRIQQGKVHCWKRSFEIVQKRCMCWTGGCGYGWSADYRLCNRTLKAECRVRSQHVWGQNCGGPGCCSYLEHISSTDCALSCFSNSLPVFCLLFRHRNLLSAVWVWPLDQIPLLVVVTFTRRV